jgi:hypothetical protein
LLSKRQTRATRDAIAELETGQGALFRSSAALMADLHADV